MKNKKNAIIIGAGPAGLTAGLELLKTQKFAVNIIEKDDQIGGLAKTVSYKKYKYDIGPHHYVTESKEIENWWKEIVKKDEFIKLKRFTRIYYNRHFFLYPLEPINALLGLNIFESIRCVCSYFRYKFFPKKVASYEDWLTNRFGKRLFEIFFKSYTEKLWGIPCSQISADWAAQRIKNFSLGKAMFFAFFGKLFKKYTPRTILNEFYYPIHGSGSLWDEVGKKIKKSTYSSIHLNELVVSVEHDNQKIVAVLTKSTLNPNDVATQQLKRHQGDYFLSTMTLRNLILSMDPLPPEDVIHAAKQLRCRALITINLIINQEHITPDHWIYIHEKNVQTIRIGNMNNFSMMLRPNKQHSAISLECFTFMDESIWLKTDAELLDQAKNEVAKIGLVKKELVLDGMVLRVLDAYPIYEGDYKLYLNTVYGYLEKFKNLKLMGRNGMHQYNNMDTAMISAMNAIKPFIEQEESNDAAILKNIIKPREKFKQESV
ncbi:MAG: Amine oxidase [candidate division TM6 bacterium GW2011_GWF2_36_6]|nr:MAG: Amine oxidase [candidate division TM6 bacterium GW2011_GWF2_36_6]